MICLHLDLETRVFQQSNGTLHVADQCLLCGRRVGNWKRHNGQKHPPWDEALTERHAVNEERLREQALAKRPEYYEYLESKEWQEKRAIVLRRANGICEGCGEQCATQVHHLTYEHLGDELLWELRAVCEDCHRRCHPDKVVERGLG